MLSISAEVTQLVDGKVGYESYTDDSASMQFSIFQREALE